MRLLGTGAAWLTLFGALYVSVYRPVRDDEYMRVFWAANFLTPGSEDFLRRAWHLGREFTWGVLLGVFTPAPKPLSVDAGSAIAAVTALVVAGLGIRRTRREHGSHVAWLMAGPFVVVLLASTLRLYPWSLRVCQFLVVPFALLLVAGMHELHGRIRSARLARISLVAATLLLAPAVAQAVAFSIAPYAWQELRPLVGHYESHGNGEPVYILANAIPAWAFYTTDWRAPDRARLAWIANVASATGPAFENAPSRGRTVREGDELVRRYRGRTEIFGVSTGMQWRSAVGPSRPVPDAGWDANEARRIQAAASPFAWTVFAHFRGPERALPERLASSGAIQVEAAATRGARLFRYRFPSESTSAKARQVVGRTAVDETVRQPELTADAHPGLQGRDANGHVLARGLHQ